MSRIRRRVAIPGHRGISILLGVYLILFGVHSLDYLGYERAPTDDAALHLRIAYNIVHQGVFSFSVEGPYTTYRPTAIRAPAYPAFLALGIGLSPELRSMTQAEFLRLEEQPRLWPLKLMQTMLLLLTSFLGMAVLRETTGSRLLSLLGLVLIGFDSSLHTINRLFLSETLAAFLMTAFCLSLVHVVKGRSLPSFALAGVTLALLALTRPAFYYFWGPVVLLLGLTAWRIPSQRRRLVAGALTFLLCFLSIVWPWMIRNYAYFGRFYLANGGGVVLKIRAGLNGMTRQEYLASFLYWSSSRYAKERLLPLFFPDDVATRLDRHNEDGILKTVLAEQDRLRAEHHRAVADRILWREGRSEILRHPLRHIWATIPIALRGVYVRGAAMSLLLFGSLIAAVVIGVRKRHYLSVVALSPAVASFALHSVATHHIPRYSIPLIPMLWAGLILLVFDLAASRRTEEIGQKVA